MSEENNLPTGDSKEPNKKPKPLGLAIILAFAPSVMFLSFISISKAINWQNPPPALFIFCCVASIIFCVISSRMFFRRGTSGTIAFAVILFLLNAFVAFAFGCGAILTQLKF